MTLPYLLSISHCTNKVPEEIRKSMALSALEIDESIDSGTREIFSGMPVQGVVMAQWSRLVVDLNRSPDQVDAKGIVALTDYHGRPVYRPGRKPSPQDVRNRLKAYHRPYHRRLEAALDNPRTHALIDCHSLSGLGPPDAPDPGQPRKDVILSNNGDLLGRNHAFEGHLACTPETLRLFKAAFEGQGLSVALNTPYQGGHIVKHYGPRLIAEGRFAIQIEMNQSLYMGPHETCPDIERINLVSVQVQRALEQTAASLDIGVKS